jgi:hypothetical protein
MTLEWYSQLASVLSFLTSVISIILVFKIKTETKNINIRIKSMGDTINQVAIHNSVVNIGDASNNSVKVDTPTITSKQK